MKFILPANYRAAILCYVGPMVGILTAPRRSDLGFEPISMHEHLPEFICVVLCRGRVRNGTKILDWVFCVLIAKAAV
jgi:hypothetical protein